MRPTTSTAKATMCRIVSGLIPFPSGLLRLFRFLGKRKTRSAGHDVRLQDTVGMRWKRKWRLRPGGLSRSIATRVRAGEVKVPTRELNVREVREVGPAGSTEQVGRSGARLLAWGCFHGVRPTDQANVRSATQVPLLRRSLLRLGSARAQRLVAHWLGNGDEVSTRAARKGRRYVEDNARQEGNLVPAACSARSHKGHRGIFSGTPVSRRGCVGMPRTRWHPLEKGCGSVEFSSRCDCSEHHHFGVKVGLLTRNINR